ncbi:hypothetical protein [Sphingomonas nostoxanthinifaciens]|nr:hypothetical protein [Sphingomonas nostoxanthinifaciens]UAK25855.1 hypothetical protein K8P63_06950 [Sphingomonas nostoxanthinifaciens]
MTQRRVVVTPAQLDDAISRLSRLLYSNSDPERFSHEKLDLVREMRGWKR